jgi:hypothetical protein
MKFSIIKGNSQVVGETTLTDYISLIRQSSPEVLEYRAVVASDPTQAESIKKAMATITPAGLLKLEGSKDTLKEYSGMVSLEIDHEQNTGVDIDKAKSDLARDKYILALHLSLSGCGLSIFVKVDSGADMHPSAYNQLADYFEAKYGITVDRTRNDLATQLNISYDPDVYLNPESVRFHVQPSSELMPEEITKVIKSSYSPSEENSVNGDIADVANFARSATTDTPITGTLIGDPFINTPVFDTQVYDQLPDIFQFILDVAEDERERDVILLGFIGLLSAIFPAVSGIHSGKRVYPNLYAAVYAPAGAGKGKLRVARDVGMVIHRHQKKECDDQWNQYNIECRERKRNDDNKMPPEPSCRSLYIKGDISTSALKNYINESDFNIIYEMESNVISKTNTKEWGNSEDVFLNSWEHEPIGKSRISDEDIEINDPKLSMVTSGTPSMLRGLIPSVDSGFFSRTCFYIFTQELIWKDQFSDKQNATIERIKTTQSQLLEIFKFNQANPVTVTLTADQRKGHVELYSNWTEDLIKSGLDREYFATISRSGRVFFRILMILTAIRRYNEKNTAADIVSHDTDFDTARLLCTTLNEHAKRVFMYLGHIKSDSVSQEDKARFLAALPAAFERAFAVQVGNQLDIPTRTLDYWLNSWSDVTNGTLIKTGTGKYKKAGQEKSVSVPGKANIEKKAHSETVAKSATVARSATDAKS